MKTPAHNPLLNTTPTFDAKFASIFIRTVFRFKMTIKEDKEGLRSGGGE